jgi:selenocysteine lyase/cysteine desulfurase
VTALGADFYAFSTYKLFGPHVGAIHAAPALLETLTPEKLVPAPNDVPDRFERGTPAFELLAGVTAAIDWIAELVDQPGTRRERLLAALGAVEGRLSQLLERALRGLHQIDGVQTLGRAGRRTSTISFVLDGRTPADVARLLARDGIWVWHGDNYAHELMKRYGLHDSGGAVRASIVLYNDEDDVDRLVRAMATI